MSTLADIETLLRDQPGSPPLDKWHPALSGDIDIRILADGRWLHEGDEIRRHPLLVLFASILRREADGEYYLVTPVEKWRIQVEDLPLMIVDVELSVSPRRLVVKTNVDSWFELGSAHPLTVTLDETRQPRPEVALLQGLSARVNRPCFYRLVELAEERDGQLVLATENAEFVLGELE